jgi:hypothetical protein
MIGRKSRTHRLNRADARLSPSFVYSFAWIRDMGFMERQ